MFLRPFSSEAWKSDIGSSMGQGCKERREGEGRGRG